MVYLIKTFFDSLTCLRVPSA